MMNLTEFLIQAVASLIAIITFLIVLNVQHIANPWVYGHEHLVALLCTKGPTNVIVATFIAAIVGSCNDQILSIVLKICLLMLCYAFSFIVPGYISIGRRFCQWPISPGIDQHDPGGYSALVISVGMASGSVILKPYHSCQHYQKS